MATRQDAISAGFSCPQGTDRVADGDEAITQNARRTYELIEEIRWERSPLAGDVDLDTLPPGVHLRVGSFSTAQHYPISGRGTVSVEQMSSERTNGVQVATISQADGPSGVWLRRKSVGAWQPWEPAGGTSTGPGPLNVTTSIEQDGSWTTREQLWDFLRSLDQHPDAQLVTIGQSYRGRDIPGLVIGNPEKPAFLAVGGQHGNEPSNTHGLMQWARELLTAPDQMLLDMCVLIVPLLNMDNWLAWRNNPEMDLNRDWLEFTQPETRAVRDWIKDYNVIGAVDGHSFGYNREVSSRVPTLGTEAVRARSQELYTAVGHAVQEAGEFYRMYEWENKQGMMHEGMAALGIPAIFTEIPSGFGLSDEDDRARPGWQQRMAALTMAAAAHKVWTWTPTYPADLAASNAPYGGLRDVTAMLDPAPASGRVLFRRDGATCRLSFDKVKSPAATSGTVMTIPAGYRPRFTEGNPVSGLTLHAQITEFGFVQLYYAKDGAGLVGNLTWTTDQTAPLTPLGTPVP